ncbi:hypothetical protein JG687_00000755 [Phytophthora cactorum]|uniref:Cell division protein FtsZ n=3 Tax=Phytophthora cactorum TaxID=29920 RepID=A0A8T1V037_9STRA|nr:hypothetical protein JG687_00000755 [Phytophthora cactorum]
MADPSWQETLASETDAAKKEWMALERRYHLQLNSEDAATQDKHVRLFLSLSDPELPTRLKGQVELQMTLPEKYPVEAAQVDFEQWSSRLSDEQVGALNAAVNARAQLQCGGFALRRLLTWIDNNFWRVIAPFEKDLETEQEMAEVSSAQGEPEVAEEVLVLTKKKPKRRRGQRPCHFFARGNCRDGDNCKFSHVKKEEKMKGESGSDGSEAPDTDATPVVREADPAQSPEGAKLGVEAELKKKKKKTRIRKCKFFAQNKCRDGDKCKFSHALKNTATNSKGKKQGPDDPPRAVVVQLGSPTGIIETSNDTNADMKVENMSAISNNENCGIQKKDSKEWSEAQQRALDLALKKYPASMDKKERWTNIANEVEGRSLNECIDRFKMLCGLMRRGVDPTIAAKEEKAEEEAAEPTESEDHAGSSKIIPPEKRVTIETEPEVQDILATTLPDCQVTKLPSKADRWPSDAAELMRRYGFNLPTSSKLVISDVVIWTDTGRLLCSDVDAFSTFVGRNYGIQLDLTEAEVLLYIKANDSGGHKPPIQFVMAISRMKAAATALLRTHQASQPVTQRLAFSTEATDAAAAALRLGFKKTRKDDKDRVKVEVEVEPESPTDVSAVPPPVVEKKLVPPAVSSTQPLWLTQDHPVTDLSGFAPKIVVVGVGGAGGNAVNNMIARGLQGVEFLVCNTDAQHLRTTLTENRVQMAPELTGGLGCGANPEVGREAAEAAIDEILERVQGANMMFVTAGMGGGTGTGAAPVIAQAALEAGILTVAVVTKPFRFEGNNRAKLAAQGLAELKDSVDTMLVIPNQNLFNMSNERTSLMDAFRTADNVLLDGVKNISDLMVMPGLINLDFADVQSVMQNMGNAMMGSGEADGENRALRAAEDALANPLLGDISIKDAKGMIVNITGGSDLTLFEVDEAAERVTRELDDPHANIIFGSTFDDSLGGKLRVSVVATGIADPDKL